MRALVTGGGGQLATALERTRPSDVSIRVCTISELDLTDRDSMEAALAGYKPDVVVNAAAYTAVDAAETDEASARMVNEVGPGILAAEVKRSGARMVQISTDFVFDGSRSTPRGPDDPTNPMSVYGRTKLGGEEAVRGALGDEALIVRTAWLYEASGRNFVNTMIRLMRSQDEIRVVADQIGSPTWADSLARAIWCMIAGRVSGIQHWTDDGVASWYDFAVAIAEIAVELGILESAPRIVPVSTAEFPTAASRPAFLRDSDAIPARRRGLRTLRPLALEPASNDEGVIKWLTCS